MADIPQVMFVHVPRMRDGVHLDFALAVDEVISFPGCGNAELQAVVYDVGMRRGGVRQHACACRGRDGAFWVFEDKLAPKRLGIDIGDMRQRSIVLLVYSPTQDVSRTASSVGQVLNMDLARVAGAKGARGPGVEMPGSETQSSSHAHSTTEAGQSRQLEKERPRGRTTTEAAARPRPSASSGSQGRLAWMRGPSTTRAAEDIAAARRARPLQESLLFERYSHAAPDLVLETVFGQLGTVIGVGNASQLANEEWFVDLEAWKVLADDFWRVGGDSFEDAAGALECLWPSIQETVFAVTRQTIAQAAEGFQTHVTDEQRLADLALAGWQRIRALGHENNCLAFSLLQVLMKHGLLADDITLQQQIDACQLLRTYLVADPALRPRDGQGRALNEAFLQHHRHAQACVAFLLEHFRARAGFVRLPDAGAQLLSLIHI